MSKSLQYVKVLNALQAAGGPMSIDAVRAIEGIVPTRMSTYLWEIKKHTGFAVKSNRNGRAVVSYELAGSGSVPAPKVSTPKAATKPVKTPKVKAVKTPKTKKVVAAPVVAPVSQPVMKDDKIVDILDEMDTNVASFEDRQFAEDFVRSL